MNDQIAVDVSEPEALDAVDDQLVEALAGRARAEGLQLVGEGGLLSRLTKRIMEPALQGEMEDHLGYARHDPAGRDGANSRNGSRTKTVLTDIGPVELDVPRDRDGSFEPQLVRKRQRRLCGVDDLVISLSAKGLTHARDRRAPPSRCTARRCPSRPSAPSPTGSAREWPSGENRPLDPVYPVIFIDAVNVKIRDGNVANRPICIALAVTVEGTRDILPAVGRAARRRGGRQVLAAGAHRDQEPGHRRRVHGRLRLR